MSKICIQGAKVWDGIRADTYAATVIIEGNKILSVRDGSQPDLDFVGEVIEADGLTLMPGLVEGHAHPSFVGINEPAELGRISSEEHMLLTAKNLELLLSHGFTSVFEAASAKPLLGVTARNAIESGLIIGPRMRAASPEITTTAGLGDERRRFMHQESFGLIGDGPIEMRRIARECVRDGVDNIKINISGDEFVSHARAEVTPMEEDELSALVSVAKTFGKTIAAHARSSKSVKMAVRSGIECIYHCDFADEEALDMLESVRDSCFVGPAFGLVHNCVHEGEVAGISVELCNQLDLYRKFETCCATYHKMRERKMRLVVGGDYGFAVTPMGQNARDIEHFVRYFGYSPVEALQCATLNGAALMGESTRLGQVKPGFLADLLLVKGDPTQDVSLLQQRENLRMIMKDGVLYKDPRVMLAH
ncbi:MAG: amidohydrolase family protein [Oceanospirillaceae bacterium]|nr:amidohydrolase family protein [Oceanospirillaceae bacterium]